MRGGRAKCAAPRRNAASGECPARSRTSATMWAAHCGVRWQSAAATPLWEGAERRGRSCARSHHAPPAHAKAASALRSAAALQGAPRYRCTRRRRPACPDRRGRLSSGRSAHLASRHARTGRRRVPPPACGWRSHAVDAGNGRWLTRSCAAATLRPRRTPCRTAPCRARGRGRRRDVLPRQSRCCRRQRPSRRRRA